MGLLFSLFIFYDRRLKMEILNILDFILVFIVFIWLKIEMKINDSNVVSFFDKDIWEMFFFFRGEC